MTSANQCGSIWAGLFFCCNQPCAILEDDETRQNLVKTAVRGGDQNIMQSNPNGPALYVQCVMRSFRENFQDDDELRPIWESLGTLDIINAIYYMTKHRASRIESGLIDPPPPIDDGVILSSRVPPFLTSTHFINWMFFAEISYLSNQEELKAKLIEREHRLLSSEVDLKLFEPAYFISECIFENGNNNLKRDTDPNTSKETGKPDKLLVVGIKGTSSTIDWLTTLWISKEELDIEIPNEESNDKRDFGVHGGILHAARYLLSKIKTRYLDEMLKDNIRGRVVFVGHSLGAAVATVCAIILREEHGASNVFCFAFAPPPAVSLFLAKKASTYVFSVVNNDDIIPRISMKQIKTLIVNIYKVVQEKNRLGSWNKVEEQWEHSEWKDLECQFASEWNEGRFDTYIPGRILFLYNLGFAQIGHVEVANEADTLRIAVLSSRMVSDHLLDSYRESLLPPRFIL